jgi:hypothetical protein
MEFYRRNSTCLQIEYFKRPSFGRYTYTYFAVGLVSIRGEDGAFFLVIECTTKRLFCQPVPMAVQIHGHCFPDVADSVPRQNLYAIATGPNVSGNLSTQYMINLGPKCAALHLMRCQAETSAYLPPVLVQKVLMYLWGDGCGQPWTHLGDDMRARRVKGNVTSEEQVSDDFWARSYSRIHGDEDGEFTDWRPGCEHHLAQEQRWMVEEDEKKRQQMGIMYGEDYPRLYPPPVPPPGPLPGPPPGPPAGDTRKRKHED